MAPIPDHLSHTPRPKKVMRKPKPEAIQRIQRQHPLVTDVLATKTLSHQDVVIHLSLQCAHNTGLWPTYDTITHRLILLPHMHNAAWKMCPDMCTTSPSPNKSASTDTPQPHDCHPPPPFLSLSSPWATCILWSDEQG